MGVTLNAQPIGRLNTADWAVMTNEDTKMTCFWGSRYGCAKMSNVYIERLSGVTALACAPGKVF